MSSIINPYRFTVNTSIHVLDSATNYWPMNESSGSIYDWVGWSNGSVTGATYGSVGVIDYALSFDGAGDFVNFGNIAVPKAFTHSAWFKCSDVSDTRTIICKRDLSGTGAGDNWSLRLSSSTGYINSYVKTGASTYDVYTGSVNLADGNWHHVAHSFDGNIHKVYVDGVCVYTSSPIGGSTQTSSTIVYAGKTAHASAFQYMNGSICEVGLFNYVLTADEVEWLYNNGDAQPINTWRYSQNDFHACLKNGYRFEEVSGPVADYMGEVDGTIYGSVTQGVTGLFGNCVSLSPSTSDYISLGSGSNFNFNGTEGFTISTLIYLNSLPTYPNNYAIITSSASGEQHFSLDISKTTPGMIQLRLMSSTNTPSYSYISALWNYPPITTGQWYRISATYDGTNWRLYVNGITTTMGGSPTGTIKNNAASCNVYIGARNTGSMGSFFDGKIEELSIWKHRVLSKADHIDLMRSGNNLSIADYTFSGKGFLRKTKAYWDMEAPSGSIIDSHASYNSTTQVYNNDPSGVIGAANNFPNLTGKAVFGNVLADLFDGTRPISVSFWYKPNTTSGIHYIIGKQQGTGAYTGFTFQRYLFNRITIEVANNAVSNLLRMYGSTSVTDTTRYYHVIVTYDGSKSPSGVKIYIDAVKDTLNTSANTLTGSAANTVNLEMASRNGSSTYANFRLDEVVLFDEVLTTLDAHNLFALGDGIGYNSFTT